METTTRREGPGSYVVTDGRRVVAVQQNPYLRPVRAGQWIARANWDGSSVSDPVTTKARAVQIARAMLADAQTTDPT